MHQFQLPRLMTEVPVKFNDTIAPMMDITLSERLDAEIAYYKGYREDIPTGNAKPEIDISEFLEQLADSKSIEIKDPGKLMKVIGKFLQIDTDLENTPLLEEIKKQTVKAEKTKKEVKFYTITETCDLLRMSRTRLYQLRLDGTISFLQHGRQVRIPKYEVDDYIATNMQRL